MTRFYGYHQAQTVAYRALRERFGWEDAPYYRRWEWPHALLALDVQPEHEVLSVGAWNCGTTAALSGEVRRLYAVDPHSEFLAWAGSHLAPSSEGAQVEYVRAKMESLSWSSASFDRVLAVSVLEHVPPSQDGDVQVMREIGRVLRPGGLAVVTVEVSREGFVEWIPPLGRVYDLPKIEDRIIGPSGLSLVGGIEALMDWDSGDWDHVWPDLAGRWRLPELIPACLVLRKEA